MVAKQKDKKKKGDGGEIGARGGPAGAGPGSAVHCLACQDKLSLDHHAAFFDAIVDLIPAKYYIGSLNEAGGAVPSKFIKKSAKADVKALFKAKKREGKLAKYDPNGPKTTTEALRNLDESNEDNDKAAQQQGPRLSLKVNAKQLSREELQAKLAKKLEELRTKKGAGAAAAKAWQQSQVRARAEGAGAGRAAGPKGEDAGKRAGHRGADGGDDAALGNGRAAGAKRKRAADGEEETGEGEGALAYSKVQVGDGKQKKRHMSKTAALQKAEEEHKRLQELQGTEEGKEAMLKKSWDVALKRAAGEKVLDDPKLLRKSIKRDRKAKQKSAEQWAERVRKQEDSQKEKQLKRFHNIAKKKQQNKQKKMEKREKKLLRPGFEGRKKGPVNKA